MILRQPRLLNESLQEKCRLIPVNLALHLRLGSLSTAEMTLPHDAPEVALRDLVELFDENGSVGIFRVTKISTDLSLSRKLSLEHSLCTLQDSAIPQQGFMCGVREAIERLLACQSVPLWTVGDVETPNDLTVIFATGYTNLLSALNTLLGMLPEGYALDFDQQTVPWKLHLRRLPNTVSCEGRLSRNLLSIRQELDSSRLCTRVYPFGAEVESGRISLVPLTGNDHLQSEAAATLGIISRTFENDLIFDVPTLKEVAALYLQRHAEPAATITVSALDLSSATHEGFDAFRLGCICRLCLPDLHLTLRERIIAIDKEDVYASPGQATLTLSNRMKQQSESAEIDELVRLVTAEKLLGGVVSEIEDKNRAYGSYNSSVVHYFDIKDWAAVLDVRATFKADIGAHVREVRVDSVLIQEDIWKSGTFSAMPYLRRDALGQIAQGEHYIAIYPYGETTSESVGVTSTVLMTVIDKAVT